MNCKEIQDIIITSYIDDEADDASKESVERHLEACAGCRAYKETLIAVTRPLKETAVLAPPPVLWEKIRARIGRPAESVPFWDIFQPRWANAVAVFSLMLLTVWAGNVVAGNILSQNTQASVEVARAFELNVLGDMPEEQIENAFIGG